MPDGKVHFAISCTIDVVILIPVSVYLAPETGIGSAGILVGGLIGTLLTPDIDQETTTFEERRILNIDPVIGTLYKWFWMPYAKKIPHRSISHWPVIGTLTRAGYVYLFYLLFNLLLRIARISLPYVPGVGWDFTLAFFLGWCTIDLFHILADAIFVSYYSKWYYVFHPSEKPKSNRPLNHL